MARMGEERAGSRRTEAAVLAALALALAAVLLVPKVWEVDGAGPLQQAEPPDAERVPEAGVASGERRPTAGARAQEAAAEEPPEARGAPAPSLRVTLRDEAGALLAQEDARVLAVDEDGDRWHARRAGPGRHELRGLAPGRYWIQGHAPGRVAVVRELELAGVAGAELELWLPPARELRVLLLTPEGGSFENARPLGLPRPRAVATLAPPGPTLDVPTCGTFVTNEGEGDLRQLGRLLLGREPPLWVSVVVGMEVLAKAPLARGVEELAFTLAVEEVAASFGALSLRAVDAASGAPLALAHARLSQGEDDERMATQRLGKPEQPFLLGVGSSELRFADVRPGTWRLRIESEEHLPRTLQITLGRGQSLELGDVTLQRAERARLTLRAVGGDETREASFGWRRADDPELADGEVETRFRSGPPPLPRERELHLAVGRWTVWASSAREGARPPLRSRPRTVELDSNGADIDLELEEPAPLVLLPPESRRELVLRGPDPTLAFDPRVRMGSLPRRLLLLPGEYELRARDADGVERVQRIALPPEGARVRVE